MFSRTPRTSWWRRTGGTGQTSRIPGQPWVAGRATPPPTTAETAASGTGTATGKGRGWSIIITLWSFFDLVNTHQAYQLKRKEIVILVIKLIIDPISTLLTTINSLSDNPRFQPKAKP